MLIKNLIDLLNDTTSVHRQPVKMIKKAVKKYI